MSGPVAPKDPEKDRSYFYIMKEKETFGSLQTQGEYQGRGVQFIYESDGRLESSAEVTGEVCDEEILKKLGTVEGFKSLVHSIGISVEMEHSREPVTFVFQMYGKEDLYGGGTLIETELRGDGAEVRIPLDTVEWKTDDDVPGQIRFVFETPEQSARVNVRFFLKDGFFVPTSSFVSPNALKSERCGACCFPFVTVSLLILSSSCNLLFDISCNQIAHFHSADLLFTF